MRVERVLKALVRLKRESHEFCRFHIFYSLHPENAKSKVQHLSALFLDFLLTH